MQYPIHGQPELATRKNAEMDGGMVWFAMRQDVRLVSIKKTIHGQPDKRYHKEIVSMHDRDSVVSFWMRPNIVASRTMRTAPGPRHV